MSLTLTQAGTLKESMLDGVKFLDDIHEVEWYRIDGRNLIIGWKRIPNLFTHTNRRAAIRAAIATGGNVHVWAVRYGEKKWKVGSGRSYICSIAVNNIGQVKKDTCPSQ